MALTRAPSARARLTRSATSSTSAGCSTERGCACWFPAQFSQCAPTGSSSNRGRLVRCVLGAGALFRDVCDARGVPAQTRAEPEEPPQHGEDDAAADVLVRLVEVVRQRQREDRDDQPDERADED